VISEWVNLPSKGDDEGFTALHYASFLGNPRLLKLLVRHGANVHATNKLGINMLHLAAQGDQAYSLTYFRSVHKLDILQRDSEHSTPLHWACFSGSDVALTYLLAWSQQ
jgi:palmitoyltransferase ZDHHC13/17